MSKEELLDKCHIENSELALKFHREGKGFILHMGHFTNWEIASIGLSAGGFGLSAIARRIKNPLVDEWLTRMRRQTGGEIISHKNPFYPCAMQLKKGKHIAILMDQNNPSGDTFFPFFGRQAATTPLTAMLSLKTRAPIFPLHIRRKNGIVTASFEDPIFPEGDLDRENIGRLIIKLNGILESWVREEPAMWLWAHNRWKRSAEAEQSLAKEQPPGK